MIYLLVSIGFIVPSGVHAKTLPVPPIAELTYTEDFILDYVLSKKHLVRDTTIPMPDQQINHRKK